MALRRPPPRTDERSRLDAIRSFFLQPQETYSVAELSILWRVHDDDVLSIFHDELMRAGPHDRIAWAVALGASVHFGLLRPLDVEHALDAEFPRVRPGSWRTVPVVVHLPAFVMAAIAREPCLPSDLPLDVRIEQLLIELFASSVETIDSAIAGVKRRPSR